MLNPRKSNPSLRCTILVLASLKARPRGSSHPAMLSETFAQYSALMVMKKKYGAAKMQKFLAYELDRYLIGRATEQKKELPLARVENQDYIHYRKGSLVMYALADYIGEDKVNRRCAGSATRTRSRARPTPTRRSSCATCAT